MGMPEVLFDDDLERGKLRQLFGKYQRSYCFSKNIIKN